MVLDITLLQSILWRGERHKYYNLFGSIGEKIVIPLKRSLSGLEVEVQTLNKEGYVVNEADLIIKQCRKKGLSIVKECSKTMVEDLD